MQETATVQCPYCGQNCEVEFDATVASQLFTTDCEVCCRPWQVQVTRDDQFRFVDVVKGDGTD